MRALILVLASISIGCASAPPRPVATVDLEPDTRVQPCGPPDRFVGLEMLATRSRDDGVTRSDALALPAVLDAPLELIEVRSRVVDGRASFDLRVLACRGAARVPIAALPQLDTIELGSSVGLAPPGAARLADHVVRLGPDRSTIVHAVTVELSTAASRAAWLVLLAGDSDSARIVDTRRVDVPLSALWIVDAGVGASLVAFRRVGRSIAGEIILTVDATGEQIASPSGLWVAIVRGRPSLCEHGGGRCVELCSALDEWAVVGWTRAEDVPVSSLAGLRPSFAWLGAGRAPSRAPGRLHAADPGYDLAGARCGPRR